MTIAFLFFHPLLAVRGVPIMDDLASGALFGGVLTTAILVILILRWGRPPGVWAPLVVREWHASNEADENGRYVYICGRNAGLLAWLLTILSLDAEISVAVLEGRVEFEKNSIGGRQRTIIPLPSISATEYGFHKPWRYTFAVYFGSQPVIGIFLGVTDFLLGVEPGAGTAILVILFSVILAAIYFMLNRKLRLGFREHSGEFKGIEFKRSLIENRDISEVEAGYVCLLIQSLIENERVRSAT